MAKSGRFVLPYGAEMIGTLRWRVFNREYNPLCILHLTEKQERSMRRHSVTDQGDRVYFYHIMPRALAYGKFLVEFYDWSDE